MKDKNYYRKLRVDLLDLTTALGNNSWEEEYYLDLETGRIILVSSEATHELEAVFLQAFDEQGREVIQIEQVIQQSDVEEWLKEMMLDAYRVESGFCERYIPIRYPDPYFSYKDMQDFICTVENHKLYEKLWGTIQGRGAFRRFKDMLLQYPEEKQRWFEFSEKRMKTRALEWLKEEGIEPVVD
jgi:hypothetical protein